MIRSSFHCIILLLISLVFCSDSTKPIHIQRLKAEDIICKHKILVHTPPSKIPVPYAVDAPLLGNGYTGVAISGNPDHQVYYLARNDFWRLKSSFNQSYPAVLGKLSIRFPGLIDATYLVEQDLFTAITTSTVKKDRSHVQIKAFISPIEDLLVLRITQKGTEGLSGNIRLQLPGENEHTNKPPFDLVFEDERIQGTDHHGTYWISRAFIKDVDIPSQAVAAMRVLQNANTEFNLEPEQSITVILSFSSSFKSENCLDSVIQKVQDIAEPEVDQLEKQHKEWWSEYWGKSIVSIPDQQIEKQYYLSLYTMASCSGDAEFPPSIFGTWITRERPRWNGDYHLNYNHMAPYYGLYSANRLEQAIPFNAPILAFMERGKYYGNKITGIADGIMLPVGIGPLGIETTRRNLLIEKHRQNWIEAGSIEDEGLFFGQKSNSAYCVTNMANHFYCTYDQDYSRDVYPFIKGVATFWEHYLKYENDQYNIYDDAIHEGTIGTINPVLSLGLVPMVMQTAIDMSKFLGIDQDRHGKWQHIIDNLAEYTYQERKGKKVFRYSEKGTDWWGDNTLGIQHIYPAGRIGLDSDSSLIRVAHNTIEVMSRWTDYNGTNSFFPAAVRVGFNPDTLLYYLRRYSDNTYPNGFQLDNPHGIENLSTVPNTINEMLCMGHQEIVRVFPVWPRQQDAKFNDIRVYGAFLVSSELLDGHVTHIRIKSEKGYTLNLQNPWVHNQVLVKRKTSNQKLEGPRLSIETKPGEQLTILPAK